MSAQKPDPRLVQAQAYLGLLTSMGPGARFKGGCDDCHATHSLDRRGALAIHHDYTCPAFAAGVSGGTWERVEDDG